MRILHVMPSVSRAFGGPTESLIGYVQAARAQNIGVHIAAPAVAAKDKTWLHEQIPEATFHFFASVGQHAYVVAPTLWLWLWRHAECFDAVHVHGLFNPVSTLSGRISVRSGVPTVMRPFGTLSRYTFSRRSALKWLYHSFLDRPALKQAAGLHFTTAAERDEANRLALNLGGRTHVVPPPWRGAVSDANFDAKADRPTVLYMSRLHPKKNVTGLIKAWQQVIGEEPDAQLWVAGTGEDSYVQTLRQKTRQHDLEDNISFLEFVSGNEKARVLREAWAFALPSHQENFGVAVLEAIAAGLPVVISAEVQLRSFVEAHDLGVVVDRTDPAAIGRGVRALLTDETTRRRVAETGPTAIQNTFSIENVGKQLRVMYDEAISS